MGSLCTEQTSYSVTRIQRPDSATGIGRRGREVHGGDDDGPFEALPTQKASRWARTKGSSMSSGGGELRPEGVEGGATERVRVCLSVIGQILELMDQWQVDHGLCYWI
ncbi:hypothetical protein S40288_10695 [Stachybotrys chartarum IBT 40288]|nr:hypothetical protein S40288_10695 [Stachybotrys chartarum IBT 40288]